MTATPFDAAKWGSVQTAAAMSIYSERHIRLLARNNRVTAYKVGRAWLINLPSLSKYAPAREGWPAGKSRRVKK